MSAPQELAAFLTAKCGLAEDEAAEVIAKLAPNGVRSLPLLRDLREEDFQEMGVLLGRRRAIVRALAGWWVWGCVRVRARV